MRKRNQGFTLIEVLTVVIIIGILFSVVLLNLEGTTDDARRTAALRDVKTLEQALDIYKLQNGFFPSTDQGLQALVSIPSGFPEPRNWQTGGYIKQLPKDPWGNDYQYLHPGANGTVDIYSMGADGRLGGEGINADIGNWN
ncbi:MAG: type II secretion system major pseudopilin GspG [Xanthomonadales bacterium]|nr:type II secretion system major pseudopilin GspG [Xanthomonadales bacterium]